MRDSVLAVARSHLWGTTFCATVAAVFICRSAIQGAEETPVAEILAAWERNRERVKSFQYRCDVEESLMKNRLPAPGKPFAAPDKNAPKSAILSHWSVTLSVSGNKVAYSKEGEHWDAGIGARYRLTERKLFDGDSERFLSEGRVTMAHIRTEPSEYSMLMQDVALTPFFVPAVTVDVLQRLGCEPTRMMVGRHHAFRDGHDCLELTIPSTHPRSTVVRRLYVDASRDYLPLELSMIRKDAVVHRSSLAYASDPDVRWRICSVRITAFDESGPFRSWSYRVREYALNKPLDEATFTLEFPEGTQVVEGPRIMMPGEDLKTRKYYVVQRGGARRSMSPRDYGSNRVGSNAPEGASKTRLFAAGIAASLFVAAAVVVWWRGWRRRRMSKNCA